MGAVQYRPFFGLATRPWKATREVWGRCLGEDYFRFCYKSKRFETQYAAELWANGLWVEGPSSAREVSLRDG